MRMPSIGLVLSGGMAKGAYQIGALQAINEIFKPADFSFISAASVGVLNTYAYLTHGLNKGVELWNSVNKNNYRSWIFTFLKGCFVQNAIKTIISDTKIKNTFYIPLVNLKKRVLMYADLGKIPAENIESYLRASVALPIYNPGVSINGECLYDGAVIDNIPVQPMLKHKIDYIVCIYFDDYNYTFENKYLDNKIIKINFTDNKIISNSICFESDSIKYMIDEGYSKAKRVLDYVLIKGIDDVDSVYSGIESLNAMNTNKNIRISGDIIVNNMNKITKKLMKRTEIF